MNAIRQLLAAAAIAAAASSASAFEYDITATLAVPDSTTIYLNCESELLDSTLTYGGKARFTGSFPRQAMASIFEPKSRKSLALVLDQTPLQANMLTGEVTGESDLNKKLAELQALLSNFEKNAQEYQASNPGLSREQVYETVRRQVISTLLATIRTNPDNGLGEYALKTYLPACPNAEWPELYLTLSDYQRNLAPVKLKQMEFEATANTAVGKKFIDFEARNPDGTSARLSDYVGKGKYVLADFWASWCGPCRREGKDTLMPLYERIKDSDNVTILGITVWDKAEASLNAIGQSGYKWPQLIDASADATTLYGIKGIPQIMLFGPDGTILARDLRGTAITEELRKYNILK